MDPDRPYRTRLIQDARDRTQTLGAVDAILVGGDIAFRGAPEEYAAALDWLKELSDQCGCPLERVFVIPGNHDVDRAVITGSASVRNVQAAISVMRRGRCPRRSHDNLRLVSQIPGGRCALKPSVDDAGDRIHACVGNGGIPMPEGDERRDLERPAKAAGRSSHFIAQGLRSGTSPKKWADFKNL